MSDLVLVTGASGYIAKHVIGRLLAQGFAVRGTVRDPSKADAIRATLQRNGAQTASLSFVEADLKREAGWAQAMAGCRFVQHIASPYPLSQPKDREALVPAAREGTLRVLRAALAAGAERLVLTSSMVAVMYRAGRPRVYEVGEQDWTDPDWSAATPYIVSKTRAEIAAWEAVTAVGAQERLVAINPGFVLGPALDLDLSTSHAALALMLKGAYPALPPVSFPIVDARDVAELHVAAMRAPVGGRRLLAAGETLSFAQMAEILRAVLPERAGKIPRGELPLWLTRTLAAFDPTLGAARADFGVRPVAKSDYVAALTGVSNRPAAEAVAEAGRTLIALGAA